QNITGQVAFGMDHADYALLRAPKPTLLAVGTQDFFDIDGSWQTFRELKLAFGRLGYGENIDLFESDEPHGFTRPRREAATRWLRRWLLDKNDATIETDFPIATDAELQCTKTGQVLSDLLEKRVERQSVFDLNLRRAVELAELRSDRLSEQSAEDLRRAVRRVIHVRDSMAPARVEVRGEAKHVGYTVRKLVYETEPGILIPVLDCIPTVSNENSRTPTVLVGYDDPGESLRQNESLLKAGHRLVFVHLRGMGETAASVGPPSNPAGLDVKEAFLSLHLNRPLLGQRVEDLLSAIATLTPNGETVRVDAK
ncbi:PKD domain-containing protein, partial [Singulisphaera rosea]